MPLTGLESPVHEEVYKPVVKSKSTDSMRSNSKGKTSQVTRAQSEPDIVTSESIPEVVNGAPEHIQAEASESGWKNSDLRDASFLPAGPEVRSKSLDATKQGIDKPQILDTTKQAREEPQSLDAIEPEVDGIPSPEVPMEDPNQPESLEKQGGRQVGERVDSGLTTHDLVTNALGWDPPATIQNRGISNVPDVGGSVPDVGSDFDIRSIRKAETAPPSVLPETTNVEIPDALPPAPSSVAIPMEPSDPTSSEPLRTETLAIEASYDAPSGPAPPETTANDTFNARVGTVDSHTVTAANASPAPPKLPRHQRIIRRTRSIVLRRPVLAFLLGRDLADVTALQLKLRTLAKATPAAPATASVPSTMDGPADSRFEAEMAKARVLMAYEQHQCPMCGKLQKNKYHLEFYRYLVLKGAPHSNFRTATRQAKLCLSPRHELCTGGTWRGMSGGRDVQVLPSWKTGGFGQGSATHDNSSAP